MRIGMLTFSYSSNPGSVLQAYALQQILSKLDSAEVHIINYQKISAGKPIIGKTVFVKPISGWTPKKIITWCARLVAHPWKMSKYEKFFREFYNGYPTERCSRDGLKKIADSYDAFVVGSDQVWNLKSPQVDGTYFLDFVDNKNKKIAYAASLGQKSIDGADRERILTLISDFSAISVREKYSVDEIMSLTKKEATWVLDPSLLLDKDDYSALAMKKRNTEKFVFLYVREDSEKLYNFAKKLSERLGLKLIFCKKHWKCTSSGTPYRAVGPKEWLYYMQNAEYVITNSFHGICFSITFEREFLVDLLKGDRSFTNPRLESILDLFELTCRNIDNFSDADNIEKIDYEKVNQIKMKKREESLEFLYGAVKRSFENG